MRPVIFLYTDAAEIDADIRAKMIEAGYLPVRVADVNSIRILPAHIAFENSDVPVITAAALDAIIKSTESTSAWAANFGANIARNIRASKTKTYPGKTPCSKN